MPKQRAGYLTKILGNGKGSLLQRRDVYLNCFAHFGSFYRLSRLKFLTRRKQMLFPGFLQFQTDKRRPQHHRGLRFFRVMGVTSR